MKQSKQQLAFARGYEALQRELDEQSSSRPPEVQALHLREIHVKEEVFQPRTQRGAEEEEELFVRELVNALKQQQGKVPLEPLTVWWSGKKWYVIDGHHRLVAYKKAGKGWSQDQAVPVTEFKGSLNQAVNLTVEANSKTKLPMTKEDRVNSAWRLICLDPMKNRSKTEIAAATGVSVRQLAYMRQALRELTREVGNEFTEDLSPKYDSLELAGWSWRSAKQMTEGLGVETELDEAIAKRIDRFKQGLLKLFGGTISQFPEEFAEALYAINSTLPKRLAATVVFEDCISEGADGDEELEEDDTEIPEVINGEDF